MKKPAKPVSKEKWATMVYLDGPRRRAVEAVAERQKRSITKQIEAFIDAGLALEETT